jgi:hypothetical protein
MAVLACALVAALPGCGKNAESPADRGRVRAVIAAADDAFFARDWKRACGYFTTDAQLNIVSQVPVPADNCPDALRKLSAFLSSRLNASELAAIRSYAPKEIEIDGDHATATFGNPPPGFPDVPVQGATVGLVSQNGAWLIDGLPL